MSAPRALVLRTAGTNCERETVRALELAGAACDLVHLARLTERPGDLEAFALLVIPGGFSYGDCVAAGRVLGFELRRALAEPLAAFVARGGLVLGICNGFQVLVETNLLGLSADDGARDCALARNESARFECRWVDVRAEACACPWIEPGLVLPLPVAHAEGRFVVRGEATLARLAARRQIALRYVAADGGEARYPECPSGSVAAIAGVCDPSGRVLGLMPHPERNVAPWHHPHWTRRAAREHGEGLAFFRRLVRAAGGAERDQLPPTTPTHLSTCR